MSTIAKDIERLIWAVKNGDWSLATNAAKTLDPNALAVVQASDEMLEVLKRVEKASLRPGSELHQAVVSIIAKAEGTPSMIGGNVAP